MGTLGTKNIIDTGITNKDSLQGISMTSLEEENKILVDSLRFYAERRNTEVGYLTIEDNQNVEIFEKDIDAGLNAKMTLGLLGIPYEDRLPDGYNKLEEKKQEIMKAKRERTLEEKMLSPMPFYFMLFTTLLSLFVSFNTSFLFGFLIFIVGLLVCVRNVLVGD